MRPPMLLYCTVYFATRKKKQGCGWWYRQWDTETGAQAGKEEDWNKGARIERKL